VKAGRSLLVLLALLLAASGVQARNPLVFFPPEPEQTRAVRYAALDRAACLAELDRRGIRFQPGEGGPQIDAPVHLVAPVHGVRFELAHPSARRPSPGPLMDCRLLLALGDLAAIARDQGIAAVRYNSIVRRGWGKKGQRHYAGVAIDVVELVKQDGTTLNVEQDFRGAGIGSRTCGERAPEPSAGKARELRELVCALHRDNVFNLILSPHYDRRHRDHLHLEVRRGIRWYLTQ
jgi:hypothetical protein